MKQFFKNIMWLCRTDLQKEWENRNKLVITTKDIKRSKILSDASLLMRSERKTQKRCSDFERLSTPEPRF